MEASDVLVLNKALKFSRKEELKILSLNDIIDSEGRGFFALVADGSGIALAVDWMESFIEGASIIEGSVRFNEVPTIGTINVNFEIDKKDAGNKEVIDLMAEIMSNIKAKQGDSLLARERALSQF